MPTLLLFGRRYVQATRVSLSTSRRRRCHRLMANASAGRGPDGTRCEYAEDVPLIALAIVIVLAFVALIPVSLILRFRAGTMRRRATGWVIALNFFGTTISVLLFLLGAAITTNWVPGTLTYTAAG